MDFKRILRGPIIWIALAGLAIVIAYSLITASGFKQITTQQGLDLLNDQGTVKTVKVVDGDQRVDMTLKSSYKDYGTQVQFYYVAPRGPDVVSAVDKSGAKYDDQAPTTNWFGTIISLLLPVLFIGAIFWFLLSSMQGGGNRVMQFGKSKAKLVSKESPKVTFADVAGADEAVEELQEIKDFLKDPSKFQAVGARIPKGVLL
jgi:cell division protease FtsH